MNTQATTVNDEQLKSRISAAVDVGWSQFAAEHPAMARAIDQTAMYDYVAESLADDAAFAQAYDAAVEAHASAHSIGTLVDHFVKIAIARIK